MDRFQLAFPCMKYLLAFTLTLGLSVQAAGPAWFLDYQKSFPECDKYLLCALGDAETRADAYTIARLEIAKFFQNKIESKSEIFSSTDQKSLIASNASFSEWTNKTVSEETTEIISGIEIKKEEQIDRHYFVLMVLDKQKTALLLKNRIEELDTEDFQLMHLNSRFAYPKILRNIFLIQALSDRYSLLSSIPLKLKVKKDTIQEKINKLVPIRMAFVASHKKLPSKLHHLIADLFSSLKVVIVPRKLSPKYTLRAELVTDEQYLKVEGFKKLNVQLRLEFTNSKMQVLGVLSALSEQLARNSEQAIELSYPDIQLALQNNLDQIASIKIEN